METIKKTTKFTLLFILLLSTFSSCKKVTEVVDEVENILIEGQQSIQDIEAILNEASSNISANVSNFESILDGAVDKITDDTYANVRDDLRDATANAVSLLGEEFRCNVQYVGDYLKKQLTKIKYIVKKGDAPPAEPGICQVNPNAIERGRPANSIDIITLSGYFFDEDFENFELWLDIGNEIIGVTKHLHLTSNFRLTINLGSNGITLNEQSQKLILMWGGRVYSEIPIIQPTPEPCNLKERTITGFSKQVLVPEHKADPLIDKPKGDKSFAGNGPCVYGWVRIFTKNYGTELWVRSFISMWECPDDFNQAKYDYTYGDVLIERLLKVADTGYYFKKIKDNTFDELWYIDNNNSIHEIIAGGGPVLNYKIVGDTEGSDLGESRVEITFKPLDVTLEEYVNDCVPNPGKRNFLDEFEVEPIMPPSRIAP